MLSRWAGFSVAAILLAGCQTSENPVGLVEGAQLSNILVGNRASYAVTELYMVPEGYPGWDDNMLLQKILPGERGYILMPHELEICLWKVRAVFADGGMEDQHNLDFCTKQQLDVQGG
jgi:hypothetical protein